MPGMLVTISGVTDAVDVDVETGSGCAVLAGGQARCWGLNPVLGDGTVVLHSSPRYRSVLVSGVDDATRVTLGGSDLLDFETLHGCVLRETGAIRCWGWNMHGQLGDGTVSGWDSMGRLIRIATPVDVLLP